MNSTLAILLIFLLLNGKQDVKRFLSDDTKSALDALSKFSDVNANKTDAILQMVSNPLVADLAQSLFAHSSRQTEFKNDEGYKFRAPSNECKEFFRPIDNVADAEIKHKLYWFYENWYQK